MFYAAGGDIDARNIGESSDTESADLRPKETKRTVSPIKLTAAFFKKNKDKSEDGQGAANIEIGEGEMTDEKIDTDNASTATAPVDDGKGLVYAELDLVRTDMKPVLKNDHEKTEYAEIVYTPKTEEPSETLPTKEAPPRKQESPKK